MFAATVGFLYSFFPFSSANSISISGLSVERLGLPLRAVGDLWALIWSSHGARAVRGLVPNGETGVRAGCLQPFWLLVVGGVCFCCHCHRSTIIDRQRLAAKSYAMSSGSVWEAQDCGSEKRDTRLVRAEAAEGSNNKMNLNGTSVGSAQERTISAANSFLHLIFSTSVHCLGQQQSLC